MFEIWVSSVHWRNNINWVSISVGGHIGDTIHSVDVELIGGEFGEGSLAEVHRDIDIVMLGPLEGSTQEEIGITHEINHNLLRRYFSVESPELNRRSRRQNHQHIGQGEVLVVTGKWNDQCSHAKDWRGW